MSDARPHGTLLNIRKKPLTKDWKERFSLSADVTPQEIYQVVEPGDSIRIINHTIEYDNTVPDVSDFLPGRVPSVSALLKIEGADTEAINGRSGTK